MPINTKLATIFEVVEVNSHQVLLVTNEGEYLVDSDTGLNLYYLAYGIGQHAPMRVALQIDTAHNHIIEINVIGRV